MLARLNEPRTAKVFNETEKNTAHFQAFKILHTCAPVGSDGKALEASENRKRLHRVLERKLLDLFTGPSAPAALLTPPEAMPSGFLGNGGGDPDGGTPIAQPDLNDGASGSEQLDLRNASDGDDGDE